MKEEERTPILERIDRVLEQIKARGGYAPCPRCGQRPVIHEDLAGYGFHVICPNCYDGAPDAMTRNELAFGRTPDAAVAEWDRKVDEGFIGER